MICDLCGTEFQIVRDIPQMLAFGQTGRSCPGCGAGYAVFLRNDLISILVAPEHRERATKIRKERERGL